VSSPERFREVEARLNSHGIDYIGPIAQLPGLLGIYFYDPNGIRLEFACQPEDGEAPAVIPCVTQTKAEARDELTTLPDVTPEWIERHLAAASVIGAASLAAISEAEFARQNTCQIDWGPKEPIIERGTSGRTVRRAGGCGGSGGPLLSCSL
jgi:hypothetical protein